MGYDTTFGQRHIDQANDQGEEYGLASEKEKNKQESLMQNRMAKSQNFSITKAKAKDKNSRVPLDGDAKEGSLGFMKYCGSCHGLSADSRGDRKRGPALGLVYGSWTGGDAYFLNYTKYLSYSKSLWSVDTLMRMMKEPNSVVQGMNCGLHDTLLNKENDGKRRLDDENIR